MPPPILSSQALAAQSMYNTRASNYDNSHHPAHAKEIATYARIHSPYLHILDLACGTGLVTIPMAQALLNAATTSSSSDKVTGSVTGVDIAEDMMAIAQTNIEKEELGDYVTLHHGDISALHTLPAGTLKSEGFDVITAASALPLFLDPGKVVRHWAKFLAPGGKLVVDVPTERSQVFGLVFEETIRECGGGDRLVWTREWVKGEGSLEGLMRDAGLEVVESGIIKWDGKENEFSEEEGKGYFDRQFGGAMAEGLRELGKEFEGRAREVFVRKWIERGEVKRVSEVDGFYVAVGRKKGGS